MLRWLRRIALTLLLLVVVAGGAGWALLRGSLPTLDGALTVAGLSAPVTVRRDALGVVTIDAANEADAMRALGYVHAQERFFEMDLMRRTAAGELAELFGPIALDLDRRHRVYRMRDRAKDIVHSDKLPQLRAYTDGVRLGMMAQRTRPWPYLLLQQQPAPWRLEDSALTGMAMYFDLQDADNTREIALSNLRPHVPAALFALLTRDGTPWDAPLLGDARADAVLPDAATLDLRRLPAPTPGAIRQMSQKGTPGSNNFAVAGALTTDGRAIVADDMHLGLRAPNIWFRARLRYADARAPGGRVDVSGFTLPGLPAMVVGSNRHIAWGFTNSYVDNVDRSMEVEADARTASVNCAAHAQKQARGSTTETIVVQGAASVTIRVPGALVDGIPARGACGNSRWIGATSNAITLDLTRLAVAASIDDVLERPILGLPAQNLVVADSTGRIAWTIAGQLRQRQEPCDPFGIAVTALTPSPPVVEMHRGDRVAPAPGRSTDPADDRGAVHAPSFLSTAPLNGCLGTLTGAPPVVRQPATHRLWTANNRTLDGEALRRVGDGGYALGARARQIRDDLFAKETWTEQDLLAIQLDDRALFLQRWWTLLRDASRSARSPALKALSEASQDWTGRASTDSVGYRIVRAWRLAVHARILDGLTAPAQAAMGNAFVMPDVPQFEGVAWPLVTQRPANLLPRRFTTWDALLEDAAVEVRDELLTQGPLSQRTWGERNTAAICHPLAKAIPLLGKRLLCMPSDQLPGDSAMPRVQGPAFGASERMVVSPGHEADGILHMPGGQSGHPLSPFWGAGHDDWVHGRATPFLPGPATHTLNLVPPVSR